MKAFYLNKLKTSYYVLLFIYLLRKYQFKNKNKK